jgi:hypothetical protein
MNLINTNNTLNQAPIQIATGNSANGNTEIEEQKAINLNKDRVANLRNSITLESADASNSIHIHSTNWQGSGVTLSDGGTGDVLYNDPDAESIFLDTGAGDDYVRIFDGHGHEIETGAGNDGISLFGDNSKASAGEGDDYSAVHGDGHELNTGSGNDIVNIRDFADGNIIETGEGDDLVTVSGTENQIDTGEGNDHVHIGDPVIEELITENNIVNTGNGDDAVDVWSGNNNTINTGDGNDTVALRKNNGSTVNTGNGDDIITVSKEASGQINGGEGEDTVLLQGKESDYVLEISKDGLTKTYTRNDGAKIVLTDVEKVIIREDVPHSTYGELGKNLIPEDSGSSNDPSGRLDDRPSHRSRDENDLIDRDPFEFRRITHQEILASLEQELEAALNSEDESQKNSIDSLRRQINITKFTINMYEN